MRKISFYYTGFFLLFAFLSAGSFLMNCIKNNDQPEYITAEVVRGDIIVTITSTGTLKPLSTVEVGTQVSGIIKKVYVDYNDTVKKGQIIAEIDRTLLSGVLDEAIAARKRAKALYDLAASEYRRNETLYKKGFISEQEFIRIKTDCLTQEAALHSAEAAVQKAATNLQYATITSPITGTVIKRNIEPGQTVAASFSSPTLFEIAEDLKKMQIFADVDEADIGKIRPGQEVKFTVQAYPEKRYSGHVEQVRLQPNISQNVVTYTVVISAENNEEEMLLPGMTATVDFIIEKAEDVLMVPNAAIRFKPLSGLSEGNSLPKKAPGEAGSRERIKPEAGTGRTGRGKNKSDLLPFNNIDNREPERIMPKEERQKVWVLSAGSTPQPVAVYTGISDGKMTEVKKSKELREGRHVITGIRTFPKRKTKSVSLFPQPGPERGRR